MGAGTNLSEWYLVILYLMMLVLKYDIPLFYRVSMLLINLSWVYLFFFSITIFDTSFLVHAVYNVSEDVLNAYPFVRPFSQMGSATFVRDDILYTVGGLSQYLNMSKPTTNFFAFQLNKQNGIIEPARLPSGMLAVAYAQAVLLPDNDRVLMFGGNNDEILDNNSTLLVHEYRFTTGVWQVLNVTAPSNATNGTVPQNRYKHTATLAPNGKIYIYGGKVPGTTTNFFADYWEYDPSIGRFTQIPIDHNPSDTTQLTAVTLP